VALFKSKPDHPWVHETYAWWDKYVTIFWSCCSWCPFF
jgi:hypothetical protein